MICPVNLNVTLYEDGELEDDEKLLDKLEYLDFKEDKNILSVTSV